MTRGMGVLFAMVTLTAVGAGAQQPAGQLTAQDQADIQQLYAQYANSLDTGDAALFAQVFTPDGSLTDESGTTFQGRDRLTEAARTNRDLLAQHFVWNTRVDPAPGGAAGRSYVVVARMASGAPAAFLTAGQFRDTLVKTPDGWRFSKREFHRPPAPANPAPAAAAPARR